MWVISVSRVRVGNPILGDVMPAPHSVSTCRLPLVPDVTTCSAQASCIQTKLFSRSQDNITEVRPVGPEPLVNTHQAWLFIDSVFPIRFGAWDLRYYYGLFRQEALLDKIKQILSSVHTHGFTLLSIQPYVKDGGIFVRFEYSGPEDQQVLSRIEHDIRDCVHKNGGIPSSAGLRRGDVWLVKGSPWREDMHRFASPLLRVIFDGPDVQEEALYQLLRPYGRILDLSSPAPVPGSSFRASTVTFSDVRPAVIARNVVHGFSFGEGKTRLRAAFQSPVQAHIVRDWITSHPKIFVPVLVFLLGTLTYTIFDPIRAFMVNAKIQDWFDYREFKFYQWLRKNTLDRFWMESNGVDADEEGSWKERRDAEVALKNYLSDMPTTVAFVHGPQGSGKSKMLRRILEDTKRSALVIDCNELLRANSEAEVIDALARQTGYWPVFTFLNSVNHMIDLASVGLIGQKAGLSSSLPEQTKQLLEVVGTALRAVAASHRAEHQQARQRARMQEQERVKDEKVRDRIRRGTWFDPRMGAVAGGGIMAELGVGDERLWEQDMDVDATQMVEMRSEGGKGNENRNGEESEDNEDVSALPIVVIKQFKTGKREDILNVFAQWSAALIEGQVAHVIVVSDNRENSKQLAKALPSKPLNAIALYDADAASALQFVKQRLRESDADAEFTAHQTECIERLGGRASDLASLIHKVRSGQSVEEAVEDIINRGVSEMRKNAFGDDVDDAKSLPWSREQAWTVLKALSGFSEARASIPYHDVLVNFPFKGDEGALRSMEKAELITIGTHDGRPSVIRPGKPVYWYVFERLVQGKSLPVSVQQHQMNIARTDEVFRATQDFAFNTKLIESSESIVRACEAEMTTLREIRKDDGRLWWWGWWRSPSVSEQRMAYLMRKMQSAEMTVEKLDQRNVELKKVLAKGG
ncbi:hypothetical protein EW146_g4901 [Bondarzewia mesenterica]|uniref:Mitochondrial escape protein 2 n=1 Tax=Bondarzewia mesenterica TaxID=1095465 RepID=A0A4S4LU54_9AGAM|nr:hypothetical protein EW146_g4901 [Bondarzewia mesenterica]